MRLVKSRMRMPEILPARSRSAIQGLDWMIRAVVLSFAVLLLSGSPASAGIGVGGAICVQEVSPGQHVTHRMTILTDADS